MEIVEALENLGFTFWQPVLLLVIYYLRREIGVLTGRLASVRIGDKEVAFHQDTAISDLKKVKERLENRPDDTAEVIDLINETIDSKLLASLCAIRRETMYLWPAIQQLVNENDSKAQIKQTTMDKIRPALNALEDSGLLTYDVEYIGPEQYGIIEFRVKKLDSALEALISEAEKTTF